MKKHFEEQQHNSRFFGPLFFMIIIALLPLLTGIGEEEYKQVHLKDYKHAQEQDLYTLEVVEASNRFIEEYEAAHPEPYTGKVNPKVFRSVLEMKEANFMKIYFHCTDYEEIAEYLEKNYEGYTEPDNYGDMVESIYAFYGFVSRTYPRGYVNPFTGITIYQPYDIYDYYIQFYEAYSNGEIESPR